MVESTVTVIMWTEAHPSCIESQIETDRSPMVKRLQLKQKREKERWPRIRDGREGEKLNVISMHLKPSRHIQEKSVTDRGKLYTRSLGHSP